MLKCFRPLGCLLLIAFVLGYDLTAGAQQAQPDKPPAQSDKPQPEKPKAETKQPATHKVEQGPFKVEVTLKGVFEAEQASEVVLSPEAWSPLSGGGTLIVKKVIDHGTWVRKGEPVLWLDTERIDQTIRDMENDRHMAELAIKLAEEELPILEKATPHDLAAAERVKRIAEEDLKKFIDMDRKLTEQSYDQMLKEFTNYLEYAREELKQLEKMYRSKDLTEETEEIILRRQRNQVESLAFDLKIMEIRRNDMMNITLPRRDVTLRENAERTTLALEKAKNTLPLSLNQKKLALTKMKNDRVKADERLEKLKRDRELMTVKAAADGIVYYGKAVRGQWQTGGDRLRRGGPVQAEDVLMTIVQATPIAIRAEVEEKDLHHLRVGLQGKATPTTAPDLRLPAKVEKLTLVPVAPGKFDSRFSVEIDNGTTLFPGMTCSIKLVPYLKEQAVTVPASAVFTDDLDDDKQYVFLVAKDGKNARHPVVTGKRVDRKVEILQGLKAGDEILLDKPNDAKKADTPDKGKEVK